LPSGTRLPRCAARLAQYREKLGGASPEEAKAALDVLAEQVTALEARLKPRRVSAQQQRTIAERLKAPAGARYGLAIVQEGGCWDCPQFAEDFEGASLAPSRLTPLCVKSNTNAIRQRTASTAQRRPQEGHAEQEDA
jgi:hypothetical protein